MPMGLGGEACDEEVSGDADGGGALRGLLSRGKADVRKLKHAQVLLKADAAAGGPGWPDERIAEAVGIGVATVERLRRRFVEEGLAAEFEWVRDCGARPRMAVALSG